MLSGAGRNKKEVLQKAARKIN